MIIEEIRIGGFGSLAGERLAFSPGINVVTGDNESGKSTAAGFIKAMLYGVEKQRGRASRTDEYTRYEPKDSSFPFEGGMRFLSDGRIFELTRTFSAGRAKDTLVCISGQTAYAGAQTDLDEILGGVSADLFEETRKLSSDSINMRKKDVETFRESLLRSLQDRKTDEVSGALSVLKERRKASENRLRQLEEAGISKDREKNIALSLLADEEESLKKRLKSVSALRKNTKKISLPAVINLAVSICALLCGLIIRGKSMSAFITVFAVFLAVGIFLAARCRTDNARLAEAAALLKREIADKERQMESIRNERAVLSNDLRQEQEQTVLSGIRKAIQILEEISERQKKAAAEAVKERTAELFAEITGDSKRTVLLDDSLEFSLYEEDRLIPAWQCSAGTRAQMDFALRTAAWEALDRAEPLPLILDDAFISYDDIRLTNVLRLLFKEKKQVILFTCQSREENILTRLGLPFTRVSWSGTGANVKDGVQFEMPAEEL